MAAGGHFGWPKITFDRISRHFRSITTLFFWFFSSVLSIAFLAISDKYTILFTKWLPAAMLDDQKSLSIAFLCISDLYATLIFFSQNGCWWPFWMTENHFRSHFLPFQINTQFLFFFHKMAAGGHFGWPKIAFDRISHHFRSIRNFDFFSQYGCRWPFWMTKNHFRSHFSPFQINTHFFHKMAAGGHFGWPKITFDRIFRHFRSIRNLDFFFTIWLPVAILDDQKSLSIAFLAISDKYTIFSQNGCWRPLWMTKNHFRSHFSPFQINTQLFCSQNGCRWPSSMTENHFRSHFLPFQINTQLLFYFFHKMAAGGHCGWPKMTFDRISRHFRSIHNFFLNCFQNGRRRPFWKSDLRQKQYGSSTMCYQWLCQIWSWSVNLWHS